MTGKFVDSWQKALNNRLSKLSYEERILEKLKYTDKELYDMERERIVLETMTDLVRELKIEKQSQNN